MKGLAYEQIKWLKKNLILCGPLHLFDTLFKNFDMTNAELIQKIRNEIERRLKDYWEISFHDTNSYNQDTNVKELKELLSFLSTLESEKPINLEEEINRYLHEECSDDDEPGIHEIAEHFAEWGYLRAAEKYNEIEYNRQRAEESVPNDLKEAADNFANQDCVTFISRKKGFIAGAKYQAEQYHFFNKAWAENMQAELDRNYENGKQAMKEQMMKQAVEGKIIFLLNGDVAVNIGDTDEYKLGQKVRIIIVKD